MNEELQTKIGENIESILTYLESGVKSGIDFGAEQVPILIQEILRFNLAENLIYLAIIWGILAITFCLTFLKKYNFEYKDGGEKKFRKNKLWVEVFKDGSESALFMGVIFSTPFAISLIVTLLSINLIIESVKIVVAPRLYLIEYLSNLI